MSRLRVRSGIAYGSTVLAVGIGAALATFAHAATGDVTCAPKGNSFIGKVKAAHNLIVPSGTSCGPTQGSTVGHDVIVEPGGAFFPGGTKITRDVIATKAKLIELGDVNNGTTPTKVGRDVVIDGTTGPQPYGNFICDTHIGRNLVIRHTKKAASGWDIGYPDPANCGRNGVRAGQHGDKIGHDAVFTHNAVSLEVGDNTIGHKLKFTHNSGSPEIVSRNNIKHGCSQSHNNAYSGTGNQVKHGHNNCNG